MAVINRRSRLVNFRLSEQELEALKNACSENGARSISDFARGAVLRLMQPKTAQEGDPQMSHLGQRMNELEMRLGLMYRLMESQYRNGSDAQPALVAQTN